MSGDDNARLIYGLMFIVLLAGSLGARRLPLKHYAKMALAWIAIFAGVFVLFLFRDDFSEVWRRAKADVSGNSEAGTDGTLRIRKDESGHFLVTAQVNGRNVDFLVDTGATVTTLNPDDARKSNVDVDKAGFPVVVETANGMATGRRASIAALSIGPIRRLDWPVHIAEGLGDGNLLGMDFLSSLKSWRVEGNELVLNP